MEQGFAERQTYDVLFGEDKPMQQKQAREEMYEKEKQKRRKHYEKVDKHIAGMLADSNSIFNNRSCGQLPLQMIRLLQ